MVELAWHYTTVANLLQIMESGMLHTTSTGCAAHERPVLWFSLNQQWEPTAAKGIIEGNGRRRTATIQEMVELAGGLVRLGYPVAKLVPWPDLWRQAGIRMATRHRLEATGRAQGSNPYDWHGSFQPIPVSDLLAVEYMNELGQWERGTQQLAA